MAQQLTESERERLDQLQRNVNDEVLAYGRQKYIVEQLKDQLEEEKLRAEEIRQEVGELQDEYESFVQDLYQRYGDVAVDLDTGDIVGRTEP
jgi:archaellum component FlaC